MPKCSLKNRILQLRLITCIFYVLGLIALIQFFCCYGQYDYPHVPEESLYDELYKATTPNLANKPTQCKYDEILKSKKTIHSWDIPKKYDDFSPAGIANGSYVPQCTPAFSVAILVTYRNRQKQLDIFLPYMHNFLRKQNIHYKIYLIEQRDESPWNKGMLYNIGAKRAIADKFPCLVLHDVDLLPLDEANLYACARRPRHMSASIDKFRHVLPYPGLVGGVLAVRADHYRALNGLSNRFRGWGGEDDDLAARMAAHDLPVLRFPRTMSRYSMLVHRQEARNPARGALLADSRRRGAAGDGYAAVPYRSVEVTPHRLFTLIGVKL